MNNTNVTPTSEELLTLRLERERREFKMRSYTRFSMEYRLERYNADFGNNWFDADSKRFFASRIGSVFHGRSPADWNIFISSERQRYSSEPRRYTVRQLQIDGQVESLSSFMAYSSSAQARRAIEKYLERGSPFA